MRLKKRFVDFIKSAKDKDTDKEKSQEKVLILFILILSAVLVSAIIFKQYNP